MEIKKIDLALQGGGAHGAYTWGVLDRLLDEERIEIDGVSGTSAGAMNAICVVYGLKLGGRLKAKEKLNEFWLKISEAGKTSPLQPSFIDKSLSQGNIDYSPGYRLFSLISELYTPKQLNPLGINPLEAVLNDVIDFEVLHKISPPKLFVCATNVLNCESKVFSKQEINSKTVLASACLPFMFDAVQIDGEYFWDGGYTGNPLITPLIEQTTETNDILLIQINPKIIKSMPKNVEEIRDRVNEISFNSSLLQELKFLLYQQEILGKGFDDGGKIKPVFLHNISADKDLEDLNLSSKLNSTYSFLLYLKELGRNACDLWIKKNFELVGKQTTLKF